MAVPSASQNNASISTPAGPHSQDQQDQQDHASATIWQPMAEPTAHSQPDVATGDKACLPFFQRHFTKPVATEPEKQHVTSKRTFSFRSKGFLVSALILLIILLGIIGAAVGVTLTRSRSHGPHKSTPRHPSPVRITLDDNFPDPALYHDGDKWYAYATNNAAGILQRPDNASSYEHGVSNIQVATSDDFVNWVLLNSNSDPLPEPGMWSVQGRLNHTDPPIPRANVWAPSVTRKTSGDQQYIMYYTATRNRLAHPGAEIDNQKGADEFALLPHHPPPHCIGAATATSALGPYTALPSMIACPINKGGAIDPAAFTDRDGTPYVAYKVDGNNIGHGGECGNMVRPREPTPIMLQKLRPDMLTPDGPAIQILDRTDADGPLVEAPELVRSHEGVYFLFYSSGCTRAPTYDLKYATADNITGPYKRAERELLRTGDWDLEAPGSPGLFPDGKGKWNLAFHARVKGEQGKVRAMFSGKVELEGNIASFVAVDGA
ncbi:hypothetical protein Q7P37_008536 [Cladosporium fusiforme]